MLIILAAAAVAVPTLRYLFLRPHAPNKWPRRRAQSIAIVVVLTLSAAVSLGAIGVGDTLHAAYRSAVARNLGAIDEQVISTAGLTGEGARAYFPAQIAERLRRDLAGTAGVAGVIARPAAFLQRAGHLTITHGAVLGVPSAYPATFGPLTTLQGNVVTLGQLGADEIYINEAAARALGAHAGDCLQLLIDGQAVPPGPTTLYFAEGYTGQVAANNQATFEEALVLRNATPFPATATLTYLLEDAHPLVVTRALPPHGTLRESVNHDIGPNRSVAVIVTSAARLTAQRLLSRLDAHGRIVGTTSAPGIATLGTMLTFPTSSARASDKVYLALANPGQMAAQVSATLIAHTDSSSAVTTQSVSVAAHGRMTLSLDHPADSLRVVSDQPIAAEEVRYSGRGAGLASPGWTIVAGIPGASNRNPASAPGMAQPAASSYTPVVQAVLHDQSLAAGGLLSNGAQDAPTIVLPLQGLQQVLGQPDTISAVLVANQATQGDPPAQSDPPADTGTSDRIASDIQSVLANTAAATSIKLVLILPRGQAALQALQQDGRLDAGTQARLRAIQGELAVPGTSDRLKSLLSDPGVMAALRTISDPAVTATLDPALNRLNAFTVQPVKQDGLVAADQAGVALAGRMQNWSRLALIAGLLLSFALFTLQPIEEPAGAAIRRRRSSRLLSRSYPADLGVAVLGIALGSIIGLTIVPSVARWVSGAVSVPPAQIAAGGVGAPVGMDELAFVITTPPAHLVRSAGPLATVRAVPSLPTTPTSTGTSTAMPTHTPTNTSTTVPTRRPTSTAMTSKAPLATRTPITTAVPSRHLPVTTVVSGTPTTTTVPGTPGTTSVLEAPARTATPGMTETTATPSKPVTTTVPGTVVATPAHAAPAAPTPVPARSGTIAINSGGGAVGAFLADQDVSGGMTSNVAGAIDARGVVNPAPQAVYQTARFGNFAYTVPNLTPSTAYTVRLHFAETYWTSGGRRIFDVAINNAPVLRYFDIFIAAGGAHRAIVKEFTATSSSSGVIRITFTGVVDNAQCNGIELIPALHPGTTR